LKKNIYFFFLITTILLFFDQSLKVWVFFQQEALPYGEVFSIKITPFFNLSYVENNGIAFGFLGEIGASFKFLLTLFRIFAVIFLCFFAISVINKKRTSVLGVVPLSLVTAGAFGNVIDSVFYGFLGLNNGPANPLFQGRVIDMFSFSFFPPVFNLADSFVCVGVFCLFLFQTNVFFNIKNSFWFDLRALFKK
jgi:signal peptidase II